MKISECWDNYFYFSGKTSDVSRQLAYAGIALIWIFKESSGIQIPHELIVPATLLIISLSFDLAQYILGSFVWLFFSHCTEDKLQDREEDIHLPIWISIAIKTPFLLKILFLVSSYFFILTYLINKNLFL